MTPLKNEVQKFDDPLLYKSMEKQCKYCNQIFDCESGRWFSNHVRWCKKNPSRNTKNLAIANRKTYDTKLGEIKQFEVCCGKCSKLFYVQEREKLFPKKENYFCCISCRNGHPHTDLTKEKISKSLSLPRQKRRCLECNQEFEVKITSTKKFCSKKCVGASKRSSTEYLTYKNACKFNFNLWNFPEKFNLDLIYKHGWYRPKNRGNNLNGISRDHKISVKFGWENDIDPKVISHPANCELMIHTENISKHKKCSLLLTELLKQIEEWDNNYSLKP